MIGFENVTLKSEHLNYRLLAETDRAALRKLLSDREVTESAGFLPAKNEEEFSSFYAKLTQHNTGIAVLKGKTLIGYIHVNQYVPDEDEYKGKPCVSIGLVIGKHHQDHGYATESLNAITAYLKQRFAYCFAEHFEENAPSKRVILKCGYRYCGQYSLFFEELGRSVRCLCYNY